MTKQRDTILMSVTTLLLIFVLGGIFGFIYEEIFYRIDLGYFVKRGTTLGPWIPIYGIGSLVVTFFTHRMKDKPVKVFFIGGALCGILEYITGYMLLRFNNERLWDYNKEIWNWGNVNGFICIRSVLFFAVSSLILMYFIIPFVEYVRERISRRAFLLISGCLGILFLIDFAAADWFNIY